LSGWTGGTWTSPDGTVTISNIQVNPSLADSLFQHSEGAIPPTATLSVTAKENASGSSWVKLTIEHFGGEALTLSDIKIIADTSTGTIENVLTSDNFPGITETTLTVGHSITLSYDYEASCVGQTIRVQLIHVPSSQLLYSNAGILVASA